MRSTGSAPITSAAASTSLQSGRRAVASTSALVLAAAWQLGCPASAAACGAVYPPDSYVRLASERTVIVWDAASKTEHFIRKPVFEGDPKSFGFFVPTPAVPKIAKESDELIGKVAALVPDPHTKGRGGSDGTGETAAAAAPSVEVMQRVRVDDYEMVTLKATGADALGEWLKTHGFVDRPGLRPWAQRYLDKGWLLNAMRYAGSADKKPEAVETPTLRLSFAVDAPFYPYTEAPPEKADEQAFLARHKDSPLAAAAPRRELDLYVIAETAMTGSAGGHAAGPGVVGVVETTPATLKEVLGDTGAWGFDPTQRAAWKVTRLRETGTERVAFDDLVFRPQDPHGAVTPVRAGWETAAIVAPAAAPMEATTDTHGKRGPRIAFALTVLVILVGLLVAALNESDQPGGLA